MKKQSLTKQAVYEAITNSNDTSLPTVRYNLFFLSNNRVTIVLKFFIPSANFKDFKL